jgi:putative N6-adenine-specific DNA methylase
MPLGSPLGMPIRQPVKPGTPGPKKKSENSLDPSSNASSLQPDSKPNLKSDSKSDSNLNSKSGLNPKPFSKATLKKGVPMQESPAIVAAAEQQASGKTTTKGKNKPASPASAEAVTASPTSSKKHTFFLSTARNLEKLLVQELKDMGIPGAEAQGMGVEVQMTQEQVYRAVYGSRLASRVLRPIASFTCENPEELYQEAYKWNWTAILKPEQTLKVTASVWDSAITHSQYAALKLKDAVVDALRDQHGIRPSVDRETPDICLDLFLRKDKATVSLYYSDGIMHRRGYRKQTVEAPLKENLAAGILRFMGWKGQTRLIDPFCGSGTFLIEAAMMATQTPAGFFRRKQGFETLPDFDAELWERVKTDMDDARTELPMNLIQGSDIDARALAATRANLESGPFTGRVKLIQKDFARLDGPYTGVLLVANPPYGVRLEDSDVGLMELYEKLDRFLTTKCAGSKAYVLSPSSLAERSFGLKPSRKLVIDNGALEVTLGEYLL